VRPDGHEDTQPLQSTQTDHARDQRPWGVVVTWARLEVSEEVAVMTTTQAVTASTRSVQERRRRVRLVAAALCALVAVVYLVLLFLVRDAEASSDVTVDSTYGAYLFLSVPYLVGAALLTLTDRRVLWGVGAAVQVAVLVLFVLFGVGLFGGDGEGVFEYAALNDLPMELFAVVVTGLQVALLVLLAYLTLPAARSAPRAGDPA
jgi:hypothetical protein